MEHSPSWGRGNAVLLSMLACVVATHLLRVAESTQHDVGGSTGWTIQSYDSWAASQTIVVGDTLYFAYQEGQHDVAEVTAANYQSCSGSNAINQWSSGDTTVNLTSAGPHYYICTITGHCPPMRLNITVLASSSSSTPATPGTTPATTPSNSSSPSSPPSAAPIAQYPGVWLAVSVLFAFASAMGL